MQNFNFYCDNKTESGYGLRFYIFENMGFKYGWSVFLYWRQHENLSSGSSFQCKRLYR